MPGNSAGSPRKSRSHATPTGRSRGEGHRRGRTQSRDSSASQESSREPCLSAPPSGRKPRHFSTDERESESLGFIPGSADSAPGSRPCGPCTPPGWGGCRAFVCCIVTCGLYGSREPCLSSPRNPETSTDDPARPSDPSQNRPQNGIAMKTTHTTLARQEPGPTLTSVDSFGYGDVRICGKKVDYAPAGPPRRSRPPGTQAGDTPPQRPVSNTSIGSVYSREELDFLDDLGEIGTDIDSLITKKLLELYQLHQIDQLAKCTSDSSFSRKTNEISDLIYSIAQDYNLEEQEAECRLVHGVIRISTRKSKRNAPRAKEPTHHHPLNQPLNGKRDGTLPDSGNETMTDTFYSNDTEPEVQVSQPTSSDALARQMRMNSGREYSSGSPIAYSPTSPQDTETDSSGTPLLHFIRK